MAYALHYLGRGFPFWPYPLLPLTPRNLYEMPNVNAQVTNYRKVMEDISRCLKPGGLAIFMDPDTEILAEDKVTILPMALGSNEAQPGGNLGDASTQPGVMHSTEGSWLQRILYGTRSVMPSM